MSAPRIKESTSARPQEAPPAASAAGGGKRPGGVWLFLRTLFIGSAGLAVLSVVIVLAGSAWLTANQRAEAEKAQPWADPAFTTTAVTTGGLLARWTDSDGNLDNGHSYVKGIYDLWKVKGGQSTWVAIADSKDAQAALPQLWQIEFNKDAFSRNQAILLEAEKLKAEYSRKMNEIKNQLLNNPGL